MICYSSLCYKSLLARSRSSNSSVHWDDSAIAFVWWVLMTLRSGRNVRISHLAPWEGSVLSYGLPATMVSQVGYCNIPPEAEGYRNNRRLSLSSRNWQSWGHGGVLLRPVFCAVVCWRVLVTHPAVRGQLLTIVLWLCKQEQGPPVDRALPPICDYIPATSLLMWAQRGLVFQHLHFQWGINIQFIREFTAHSSVFQNWPRCQTRAFKKAKIIPAFRVPLSQSRQLLVVSGHLERYSYSYLQKRWANQAQIFYLCS